MGALPPDFSTLTQGHQVYLSGTDELGDTIDVYGCVGPDGFGWGFSAEWKPLIPGGNPAGIVGLLNHPLANTLQGLNTASQNLTGYSALNPALTTKLWDSTSDIVFDIDFEFIAINDVQNEVIEPMIALNKMLLPSVSGAFLRSPGQTFLDINNTYNMTLLVGNFTFQQVIVRAVQTHFDPTVDRASQYFNSARCAVTFETSQIVTKQSFTNMMGGVGATQNVVQTPLQGLASQFSSALSGIKSLL